MEDGQEGSVGARVDDHVIENRSKIITLKVNHSQINL